MEAAIGSHPAVSEAAAIQIPHEVKGHSIFAYVILKPGFTMTDDLKRDMKAVVRQHVGPFATPDQIQVCAMPAAQMNLAVFQASVWTCASVCDHCVRACVGGWGA